MVKGNVVITGGSRGIGSALAIKYKNLGYNVVISYLNSKNDATLLQENYGIDAILADSSKLCDVEKLFEYTIKKYGSIDIVINNAGVCLNQKLLIDTTEEEFDYVFNTNVKGVYNVLKVAINNSLSNKCKIINVSSCFSFEGGSCEAIYSASKSAINMLTKCVGLELDSSDIIIVAVALGLIDTDMNKHLSTKDKEIFVKELGLDKIPTKEEVAEEIYKIENSLKKSSSGQIFKVFC